MLGFVTGAMMLVLICGAGVAGAQTQMPTPAPAPVPGATPVPGPAPSLRAAPEIDPTAKTLKLSPEQRAAIAKSVVPQKVAKPLPAELKIAVGTQLPPATMLQPMPENIMEQIPQTKLFQFTMWNGRVVVVDPTALRVVAVID